MSLIKTVLRWFVFRLKDCESDVISIKIWQIFYHRIILVERLDKRRGEIRSSQKQKYHQLSSH